MLQIAIRLCDLKYEMRGKFYAHQRVLIPHDQLVTNMQEYAPYNYASMYTSQVHTHAYNVI